MTSDVTSHINNEYFVSSDTASSLNRLGTKQYELTDHLGNVVVTILDKRTGTGNVGGNYTSWLANVSAVNDYYPFGFQMSERSAEHKNYRFSHNTQEKTDEIAGKGNHHTAQFWEYSPRIARRWNVDPKPNVSISPYATFANSPILMGDPLGDTTWVYSANGILHYTIFDNLENQIHFMPYELDIFENWGESRKADAEVNDVALWFRSKSTAFIGKNSIKSLQKLAMESAKIDDGGLFSGREFLFYAEVTNTKEIIFKELPVLNDIKSKASSSIYPIKEAISDYNHRNKPRTINDLYAIGHTHTRGWFRAEGGAIPFSEQSKAQGLQHLNRPSGEPGSVDYYMGGISERIPRFIASPRGFTIYNAEKKFDPDKNVYDYDSFKK